MRPQIPVNPVVLRWARESLQIPVEDAAAKVKKDSSVIESWERGDSSPTYIQLETLAYELYKRPIAVFFYPTPPSEEDIERIFRTLPDFELERMPSRILYLLRKAQVLQDNVAEIFEPATSSDRNILHDLEFSPTINATDMATRVRDYLDVSVLEQATWKRSDEALRQWRLILESHGIYIFKDSFKSPGRGTKEGGESQFSGFCLFDPNFPLIYVNNNNAKTRQIFTLFHELAHLLMATGGVDMIKDEYITLLKGNEKKIEELCNRFAAEFLVPAYDFKLRAGGMTVTNRLIENLAEFYSVSREVILRRFLDRNEVSQEFYNEKVAQWQAEWANRKRKPGGTHQAKVGAYLGERYIREVFRHHYQGSISIEQAATYLNEKPRNLPAMEEWLWKREVRS